MSLSPATESLYNTFVNRWDLIAEDIYRTSKEHGFHGNDLVDNIPTKLMLIVSEIAEAMEAHRTNAMSDKLPMYSGIVEELADAVIRIMDLGAMLQLDIGDAVVAKHEYNKNRPFLHGGKAY